MKVIIISVPLGSGHASCAKALKQQFDSMNIESTVLDLYEYIEPSFKKIIEKAYFYTMKSALAMRYIANELYNLNEQSEPSAHIFANLQNEIIASKLKSYITEYNPDLIICTQVYATQVIDILKKKEAINCITCGIITDFTVQTYWEDTKNIEYIATCSPLLNFQAMERGIPQDKILPFGIPIGYKFTYKNDMALCRKQLGFNPDKKCVLIMSGGFGYGKISEYIKEIDACFDNIQIAVICGRNQELYNGIQSMEIQNEHHIFGFSDNVDIIMDACDCIVTKPGGITTSEALAKKLPIIICEPLPGMEERNVEFLLNCGCALSASKTFSLADCLHILLETGRGKTLKDSVDILSCPNSTKDLCNFLVAKAKDNK